MKYFIATLLTLFTVFASPAFGNCIDAKLNEDAFLKASIGEMINIVHLRISKDGQNQKIQELIKQCMDVEKIAKRVLGRAKWQELNLEEQQNFLKEYPIYFTIVFRNAVMAAMADIKDFTWKKSGTESFDVLFQQSDSKKQNFKIVMTIEERNGLLKITDGKFAEVSIVESQKQMFDRLYDQDNTVIKEFKALKHLNEQ